MTFTPSFAALACWQAAAGICGYYVNPQMNEKCATGHLTKIIKPFQGAVG